jgi:hypothetical protein
VEGSGTAATGDALRRDCRNAKPSPANPISIIGRWPVGAKLLRFFGDARRAIAGRTEGK